MDDQLLMDNYLLVLKSTVEVYVHGTLESVNDPVRKVLADHLKETMTMQKTTYKEMTNRGWYTIENISSKEIQKVYQKASQ